MIVDHGGCGIRTPVPPRHKSSGINVLQHGDAGRGAESGASKADSLPIDDDLAAIDAVWPDLPNAVKAGIVAMVQAAKGAEGD